MNKTLLMLNGSPICRYDGGLNTNFAFGKVVTQFARHYSKVVVCVPEGNASDSKLDYRLPKNVDFVKMPTSGRAISNLINGLRVARIIKKEIKNVDHIFSRGVLTPACFSTCVLARLYDKPIIHWLPGNPKKLLKMSQTRSAFSKIAGSLYASIWYFSLSMGQRLLKRNYSFCNGSEIYKDFNIKRGESIISTTLEDNDFLDEIKIAEIPPRINIVFISYVRPEKGLDILIESLIMLKNKGVSAVLNIYGSRDSDIGYQNKIDLMVEHMGLAQCVCFHGHVRKEEINDVLDSADILVLPSLSEGTPRILLEAQARCIPVVATNVGGVPDVLGFGCYGVLVEPNNPAHLSLGILRYIDDEQFRASIVNSAYKNAKQNKVSDMVSGFIRKFKEL